MCYFLTISVPASARHLLEALDGGDFEVWQNTNASIHTLMPGGTSAYWVTTRHCSCDLCPDHAKPFDEEAERRRYEKCGWGSAKVERAIAAKRPTGLPVPPKLQRLYEALRGLLPDVGEVHLFGHWYDGDQTQEKVVAKSRKQADFETFLQAGGRLEAGVVLSLRAA